ncbi:hypothetical protein ACQ4PT_040319 [Festuca glaucescens]
MDSEHWISRLAAAKRFYAAQLGHAGTCYSGSIRFLPSFLCYADLVFSMTGSNCDLSAGFGGGADHGAGKRIGSELEVTTLLYLFDLLPLGNWK